MRATPPLIMAVDAQYDDAAGAARVGALWFDGWTDPQPAHAIALEVSGVAPYQPGRFFLRELPCIEQALDRGPATRCVVVDGYVDLGPDRPGLGRYVHRQRGLPVVGVAKTWFRAADAVEVLRGQSSRPLFVTATGSATEAAAAIRAMHGPHRIPTLLKWVDQLARGLIEPG